MKKNTPGDIKVTVNLNAEEGIIFEQEYLSYIREQNIDITMSGYLKKIIRDFIVRKRKPRYKTLPKYVFKE